MLGRITKVQRFTIHDGPGIRSTVFLKGCPLSCAWCQNPETVTSRPEILFFYTKCIQCKKCIEICPKHCFSGKDEIQFKSMYCTGCGLCTEYCPVGALTWSFSYRSPDDILEEVMKDKTYYDLSGGGVTLSGGEPLFQMRFCEDLISKAKTLGLHVAVDTSGYVAQEELIKILPYVDLFLYDIKFVDAALHKKYTKRSNALILSNFKTLCEAKKRIIVRIPLIPGITNLEKNLLEISEFVKQWGNGVKVDYIPFNPLIREKYRMIGKECPIHA